MKLRTYVPLMFMAGILMVFAAACGPSKATQTTTAPQATLPPTQAPVEAPAYFTEEFDSEIPDWSWFLQHGEESQTDISTEGGRLVFKLDGEEIYAYLMYDPWIYKNVRIDTSADNRGKNTNSVMLICRYSEDEGWYEFNIGNDGLYQIWAYDKLNGQGYQLLQSGGSTAIRPGRDTNEYSITCEDDTLSLYINGQDVKTFQETRFRFREGLVGIGVSSYNVLPIQVEFSAVTISEP